MSQYDDHPDRYITSQRRDDKPQNVARNDISLRYRTLFDLHPIREEGDAFGAACDMVAEWIIEKERQYTQSPIADDFEKRGAFPLAWSYSSPEGYHGGAYDEDRWPALACESRSDDDGNITCWIVEYDEPDLKHDDRRWHTTICLKLNNDDSCSVGVESICRLLNPGQEKLPEIVAAPSLVRMMLDIPWFVAKRNNTQLQTVPNKLSVQTFEHFSEALIDPHRTLPLVLFCTGYNGKVPEQAKQLARRAIGNANVYIIDWSNDELRQKEQELFKRGTPAGEYACPKSSARMYVGGIDLTNPNRSRAHKSWDRAALEAQLPSQFAESLARRFLPNEPILNIADLTRSIDHISQQV